MEENKKKLVQLRTKLEDYKLFKKKVEDYMFGNIPDIDDLVSELYNEVNSLEEELIDLKMEMDLPDNEWDEDENKNEDKFA